MRFWMRLRSARSVILVQSSSGLALALKALLVPFAAPPFEDMARVEREFEEA